MENYMINQHKLWEKKEQVSKRSKKTKYSVRRSMRSTRSSKIGGRKTQERFRGEKTMFDTNYGNTAWKQAPCYTPEPFR